MDEQSRNSWIKEDDPVRATALSRHKDEYEDILAPRRESSDLRFIFKTRNIPNYKFNHARTPAQIKQHVLRSDRVIHVIEQLCRDKTVPEKEVEIEAKKIMDEMAHNFNMGSIRGFAFFLTKVIKKLCRRMYVNEEGIEKLRNIIKDYPVVLMPTHRSYADFLLLSYVCYHYDLPLPVIAAAMDFKSMKFFGELLRNCGAFFIRRSFGSDKLYWAIFTEYVQTQLINGDAPVEFFVEGTRSRTGKSYYPKKGMLSIALEPYFKAFVPDIMIVPISISYDRILEESLYAYEMLGIPKPKESTSGLLAARGILNDDYGKVHLYFGDPISIRQFSDGRINRLQHALSPRYIYGLCPDETELCDDLAFAIMLHHQKHMVVSPWALVATILLQNHDGIFLKDLSRDVEWLKRCATNLGAYVDWPGSSGTTSGEEVLRNMVKLHHNLVILKENDLLTLKKVVAAHVGKQAINKMMTDAATHLILASYRNQIMHSFVRVGLLSVPVNSCNKDEMSLDDLYSDYCFLENLLHREFIFRPGYTKQDFELALKVLVNSAVLFINDKTITIKQSTNKYNTFFSQMLEPFLLCYWIVCQYLMSLSIASNGRPQAKQLKMLSLEVQMLTAQLLKEGVVKHYEMMSLDLLSNSLMSLVDQGALTRDKREGKDYLLPSHTAITKIAKRLGTLVEVPCLPASRFTLLPTTAAFIQAKL